MRNRYDRITMRTMKATAPKAAKQPPFNNHNYKEWYTRHPHYQNKHAQGIEQENVPSSQKTYYRTHAMKQQNTI